MSKPIRVTLIPAEAALIERLLTAHTEAEQQAVPKGRPYPAPQLGRLLRSHIRNEFLRINGHYPDETPK